LTLTLTPEQRDTFDRLGILRLPGFYPRTDIDRMADRIWADLERRFGVIRNRPESWTVAMPAHFQALTRSDAFDALGSRQLFDLADALLGAGAWDEPKPWGGPLVSFPTPTPPLRRPPWHLDIGGGQRLDPLPILRTFTFLEPLAPGGGGTLFVAGSHRFALELERDSDKPVRSAAVRQRLKSEHPWFARLLAADSVEVRGLLNVEARVGEHEVRLEEMTGEPADLIIMHPATLHATAHNGLDRPRMMLTTWTYRREGAAA
jgi:Phytanoyl-CoA dioxygenase (PhyH)